jgi:hypothetical protein
VVVVAEGLEREEEEAGFGFGEDDVDGCLRKEEEPMAKGVAS